MTRNTTFRKLDLFPSSGDGRETPTLIGSLERYNLNHRIYFFVKDPTEQVSPSTHLKKDTDPVSETFFLVI
jgi:hypothetical protein